MTGKKHTDKLRKAIPINEENVALEVAEDQKLRSIGIDPDGDPVQIMVELERRVQEYAKKHDSEDGSKA